MHMYVRIRNQESQSQVGRLRGSVYRRKVRFPDSAYWLRLSRNDLCKHSSDASLHRDALGQITWLVDITSPHVSDIVRHQLRAGYSTQCQTLIHVCRSEAHTCRGITASNGIKKSSVWGTCVSLSREHQARARMHQSGDHAAHNSPGSHSRTCQGRGCSHP